MGRSPHGKDSALANIPGGPDADVLTGTNDHDTITGTAGDDSITGLLGADLVFGGSGNDSITGMTGAASRGFAMSVTGKCGAAFCCNNPEVARRVGYSGTDPALSQIRID